MREGSSTCPACDGPQVDGLLCEGVYANGRDTSCTHYLRRDLIAAADLPADLDIATSRQARIGGGKAGKGSAHERWPYNPDAVVAADRLRNALTTWARDVAPAEDGDPAAVLLAHVNDIRKHPAAAELVSDIGDAVRRARWAIDRPAERLYLGTCLYEEDGLTCHAEIWASMDAESVVCTQCEITHEVSERRRWLLAQAADLICTVREASSYLGEVGGIPVTQASIKGYLHRKRLAYRPGSSMIRLGDLLAILVDETGRRSA